MNCQMWLYVKDRLFSLTHTCQQATALVYMACYQQQSPLQTIGSEPCPERLCDCFRPCVCLYLWEMNGQIDVEIAVHICAAMRK